MNIYNEMKLIHVDTDTNTHTHIRVYIFRLMPRMQSTIPLLLTSVYPA